MLQHAQAGRTVARLKGGDPAVFARTAEEVDALRAAEIPFEIVPGITAALAASSYAGIPVTHRGLASAVALVTGHEEPGKPESALDWSALAKFPGTLVIYMGVTTAKSWSQALIDGGKPPETPAALIRRCSLEDQQTIHCRLDEVAGRLTPASEFRPPVIVILGEVTELASTMSWLQNRPLFGKTVLVTRPVDQADSLSARLRELGATVIGQPAIEIGPPDSYEQVDAAIHSLGEFDTIVFCSRNGVCYFLDRLLETGNDLRKFGGLRIAAVGKQTATALSQYYLQADIIPADFDAESLASELVGDISGQRVLIVRASRGKDNLAESLAGVGGNVSQVVAYTHRDVDKPESYVTRLIENGSIDWVTVTSSATAANLTRMFGDSLRKTKIASLSPVTTRTLTDLGLTVLAEANPYTMEAMVDALLNTITQPTPQTKKR
jgi:uroporphyrinogen III methyltransferase/synthase